LPPSCTDTERKKSVRGEDKQNKTKINKLTVLNNWRMGIDSVGFFICQEVRDYCAILFSADAGLCMCETGPCSLVLHTQLFMTDRPLDHFIQHI
jgi:hypothetical protein